MLLRELGVSRSTHTAPGSSGTKVRQQNVSGENRYSDGNFQQVRGLGGLRRLSEEAQYTGEIKSCNSRVLGRARNRKHWIRQLAQMFHVSPAGHAVARRWLPATPAAAAASRRASCVSSCNSSVITPTYRVRRERGDAPAVVHAARGLAPRARRAGRRVSEAAS